MSSASTSLTRGESNVLMIQAKEYVGITDRASPAARRQVETVLVRLVDAVPTSVHPDERSALIEAILRDLEDTEGATWTRWTENTTSLALAAVKALSRNPLGSEIMLRPRSISIILHHTALPLAPSANPFSSPPHPASSSAAQEALKVIANLLVLRPEARQWAANKGVGAVVARDLASLDPTGLSVERLFLLSRLGFLVALEAGKAVDAMVEEGVVESCASLLMAIPPVPANYMALTELLKLVHAVIAHQPHGPSASDGGVDPWLDRFDVILAPLLSLLYNLPQATLNPPLAQVIHALLLVPYSPRLTPVWRSVPKAPASHRNGNGIAPVRTLMNLFGSLALPSDQSSPRRSPTPTPEDAAALPRRLLSILQAWFDAYVPFGVDIDDDQLERSGVQVDAALPPITLVLVKLCNGDPAIRQHVRQALLPDDLDRSSEAGPLEKRKGLLGDLLRVMASSLHSQARLAMGELFWSLAGQDATTLTADIGYGISAGLMLLKGVAPPTAAESPSATITEIPDEPSSSSEPEQRRNLISGLAESESQTTSGMTDEEKEREAERLFVLFERIDRNKVLSTGPPGGHGVDMLRKAVEQGKGDEWERIEAEKERAARDEAELRDEQEALKEVEALRARRGKAVHEH